MNTHSKSMFHIITLFALLASLLGSALTVTPVRAMGFTVTKEADTADGTCDGDCSLREAITAANALAGADTITVPAGTYTLGIASTNEDANVNGDLDITQDLTINGGGPYASSTIIQAGATPGSGIDRVFHVIGAITVSISTVTIANSNLTTNGGGILNNGILSVTNIAFSGNYTNFGGGIYNSGTLTVTNSTFSGNNATGGGGIFNTGGTLTVTNSTFSGNYTNYGGGIYNDGTLTVTNSTFSGNNAINAVENGGGIYNNTSGTLNLKNTILANSTSGSDCRNLGTIATNTNNLIETNGAGANACGTPVVTSDPGLGALADNGGPTQTFAITSTSSAYNAGDNATCAITDQRGVTRPQAVTCDIGSFESNGQPGPLFDVNTAEDSNDGACDAFVAGLTDCTLREAITAANNLAGADTINVPAGTYTLTLPGAGENLNAAGDLDITDSLTIIGAGAGTTIIRAGATPGSGIDRVFHVIGAISVGIYYVTIANGKCSSISCNGGGINNSGSLTVTNSAFSGNSATDYGGGIFNLGSATVTNSTFSGNSAGYAGAIFNDIGAEVTVTNSAFSGNSADYGGGIWNDSSLTVTNSTFSGNSAVYYGGGINNDGSTLTVTNSTFSDNSAGYNGGGIFNYSGSLTVTNSTFSGNSSAAGDGGGIYNTTTLHLKNTLVANSASGGDCYNNGGTVATDVNNLIETNSAGVNACGTPVVTSDPGLGALADNGGPTQTFAITSTSSAYNAGDNATCAITDQRGVTRPQAVTCDIGSFEFDPAPFVVSSVRVNPSPTANAGVDFTVTFSESVTGVNAGDFALTTSGVTLPAVSGVSGSGSVYTVTVNTGSGNGTIRLDVPVSATITDLTGNPLASLPYITGDAYTVTKVYKLFLPLILR